MVFATCFGCSATHNDAPAVGGTTQTQPSVAPVDASLIVDAAPSDDAGACPSDMVLVSGSYCPEPLQICRRWLDPPGPYQDYRCAEYAEPATCPKKPGNARVPMRFCIDREEYVPPGDPSKLPLAHQSWTSAGEVCAGQGKRLCLESEWQFACEGEEMRPYPYGFKRDATACNIDRMDLGRPNSGLKDDRAPITDYPRCLSPFGVHDMSGNIEEWATLDHGVAPQRSSMKGAWWLPGKNTCRARTLGHGEVYAGAQVGVRCCK
jgi:sulfatase modifying factor 1